jgi:hypothetical protein
VQTTISKIQPGVVVSDVDESVHKDDRFRVKPVAGDMMRGKTHRKK